MPIQFTCANCGTRYLYEEVVKEGAQPVLPPMAETLHPKTEPSGSSKEPPKPIHKRSPRRLKGEFDERDVRRIAKIPGAGGARARALCKAGYSSLQKIKSATLDELSAVPGVGLAAAKTIKNSTDSVLLMTRRHSKEELFNEERECPKCGFPAPVFSETCLECGTEFDFEGLGDVLMTELRDKGIESLVEFYGHILCNTADDAQLWYALALALSGANRVAASKKAMKKALKLDPDNVKYRQFGEKLEQQIEPILVKEPEPVHPELKDVVMEKEPEKAPSVPAGPLQESGPEAQPAAIEILEEKPKESLKAKKETPSQPQTPEIPTGSKAVVKEHEEKPGEKQAAEAVVQVAEGIAAQKDKDQTPPVDVKEKAEEPAVVQAPIEPPPRAMVSARTSSSPGRRLLLTKYGLVNGKGRVNGLINGNGFINGGSVSEAELPSGSLFHRHVAVGAFLIAVFLIVNITLQLPIQPSKSIQIDGNFSDWQPVGTYHDATVSTNPNTNLTSYALRLEGQTLFFMATVEGTYFADTQGYDALYLFMDVDGDNSTGYWCGALGADYMVYIEGFNSTVSGSSLQLFVGQDKSEWNQWHVVREVNVAVSGGRIEGEVATSLMTVSDLDSLMVHYVVDDQEGGLSQGRIVIGPNYGALMVTQRGLTRLLPTGSADFLELTFHVTGPDLTLIMSDITVSHTIGTQINGIPSSVTIREGNPRVLIVEMDASVIATGDVVQAWLESVRADRPVTIMGSAARAYVISSPNDKRVDGLFGEWTAPHMDSNALPPEEGGVDVEAHDGNITGTTAFFYVKTAKDALEGSIAPLQRTRTYYQPGTGGSGSGSAPRVTGESIARFYIQSGQIGSSGLPVGGVLADYMIEVRGKFGSFRGASTYQWQGRWVIFAGAPRAAIYMNEVEVSMAIPGQDLTNASYVIETRDWRGNGDQTVVMGTRGDSEPRTRGLQIAVMGSSTLLTAKPTSTAPTIDGDWSSSEWNDADSYDNGNLIVYTMQNGDYVFFAIRVKADTNYDAGDYVEVALDTDDGGEGNPQSEDRMFSAIDPNGNAGTEDYCGNGAGWDQNYESPYTWSANGIKDTDSDNYITFEFALPFEEVWGTPSPGPTQMAGLAVHAHDANGGGADYYWGSSDLNNPSTYGTLDIPEFGETAFVALVVPTIVILLCRRPGKINKHRGH